MQMAEKDIPKDSRTEETFAHIIMKHLRTLLLILLGIVSFIATSCVHEFVVTDYSFEFAAKITYDDKEDIHRLTLTKVAGLEENEYSIAFTLDGQNNMSLTQLTTLLKCIEMAQILKSLLINTGETSGAGKKQVKFLKRLSLLLNS